MDVVRAPKKRGRRALVLGGLAVLAALGTTVGVASLRDARPPIARSSARLEQVRRGAFVREVQARGTLVPEEIQWVTADGPARVARIAVAPGATVSQGDVLVELVNAELELATLDAERQTAGARAALAELEVQSGAELLSNDALVASLRADAEVLATRAVATDALAREGITPALDRDEAGARAKGASRQLDIEQKRRSLLDRGQARRIASQRDEIAKLEEVATFRRKQLDALRTPSPVAGVVQEMPLEPGQWVTAGTVLAKIAKPGRLKAVVQVPEALVADVAAGQTVRIEISGRAVEGKVARVDPLVQGGAVRVEVTLDDASPEGARADLAVTATIEIERAEDALVVSRPAGIAAGGAAELYVLDADGAGAARKRVRFGRGSVREIEILEGLAEGDTVVLVDGERTGGAPAIALFDER
jgi:multidrug efflux pump subunit AcrA (membrane-fusion protein)